MKPDEGRMRNAAWAKEERGNRQAQQGLERSPEKDLVPKAGVEPACPKGRRALNAVRLPFRHFGTKTKTYEDIELV